PSPNCFAHPDNSHSISRRLAIGRWPEPLFLATARPARSSSGRLDHSGPVVTQPADVRQPASSIFLDIARPPDGNELLRNRAAAEAPRRTLLPRFGCLISARVQFQDRRAIPPDGAPVRFRAGIRRWLYRSSWKNQGRVPVCDVSPNRWEPSVSL